jgi:hypothetical protein
VFKGLKALCFEMHIKSFNSRIALRKASPLRKASIGESGVSFYHAIFHNYERQASNLST